MEFSELTKSIKNLKDYQINLKKFFKNAVA